MIRFPLHRAAILVLLTAMPGCKIFHAAATGGSVTDAARGSWDAKSEAIDKITGDEERAVGQAAAISVIAAYGGLLLDEDLNRYVNEVGNAVARVGERKARRRNGEARIKSRRVFVGVLKDPSINAFGLPGGYILVTRGLLESLQSESELAWVLGHEMSHCDNEDGLSALKTQVGGSAFVKGSSELNLADKVIFGKVADWYANFMVTHGFDQKAERKADELGLTYSTAAGYDSLGAWRVLTTLGVAELAEAKTKGAKKDASHESASARYENLKASIGAKKGGKMGSARYDEQCLRRLEAYAVAQRPAR